MAGHGGHGGPPPCLSVGGVARGAPPLSPGAGGSWAGGGRLLGCAGPGGLWALRDRGRMAPVHGLSASLSAGGGPARVSWRSWSPGSCLRGGGVRRLAGRVALGLPCPAGRGSALSVCALPYWRR
ncbi:unnamed protein product [Lampetra planeri]